MRDQVGRSTTCLRLARRLDFLPDGFVGRLMVGKQRIKLVSRDSRVSRIRTLETRGFARGSGDRVGYAPLRAARFRCGDLFAVFLRVVGMLAPVAYRPTLDGNSYSVSYRPPFVGTLEERAESMSMVLFVLFMLASTTYDGMHQTIFWMGLYYNHLLSMLHPLWGTDLLAAQVVLEKWYTVYQRAGLVLFPFFYLAIYLGVLGLVKITTRTSISVRTLALEFAFSIVPIAFVYNVAHYLTLILVRIPTLPFYLTDPFGLDWNPFGFAFPGGEPPVLDMAIVWHAEVALILAGHLVSAYLAHRIALRLFPSRREAVLSQLPILLLMVMYTVIGLWVISLPFALT
jgi:hypothetical protein